MVQSCRRLCLVRVQLLFTVVFKMFQDRCHVARWTVRDVHLHDVFGRVRFVNEDGDAVRNVQRRGRRCLHDGRLLSAVRETDERNHPVAANDHSVRSWNHHRLHDTLHDRRANRK